jgi:hypothetical protein
MNRNLSRSFQGWGTWGWGGGSGGVVGAGWGVVAFAVNRPPLGGVNGGPAWVSVVVISGAANG